MNPVRRLDSRLSRPSSKLWLSCCVLAALGAVGCGNTLYAVQANAASSKLEEARELGAEKYAPYEYFFAKEHLEKCGQPDGFETSMAFRSDRPKEEATAEAFQQALGRVGIKLTLKGYPAATYFSENCGLPPFVVKNNLGLCTNGWGADWNDGFGFLSQIVDSRVIRETGGSSNTSVRIPEVDQMLDEAVTELDQAKREQMWGEIDKRVMEEAVIYPGVYEGKVLIRGKGLTNVFVNNSYGMYDFMELGLEQ